MLSYVGGMAQYRSSLALSFFYKFYLHVAQESGSGTVHPTKQLSIAGNEFERPAAEGLQHYDYNADETTAAGSGVGVAVKHCAADLHTTGTARCCTT